MTFIDITCMSDRSEEVIIEIFPRRNDTPFFTTRSCRLNQKQALTLLVVEGNGPSLLGRNWLTKIRLDWNSIYHMTSQEVEATAARHPRLFEEGVGKLEGYQAKLHVDKDAKPIFCKAWPVPYAMRERVEKELDRLVEEGTLKSVQYADWAAPIVPVLKKDGESVRICGDFKQTVNKVASLDHYPLPRVEDLLAKLSGGKKFSVLDLSQAYQQLELEAESQTYTVINTHKGLFSYTRLPYGIASSPGIFQRAMDSLLQGIEGVVTYIDDVLVTGPDDNSHIATLDEVMSRLEKANLRLQKAKCSFMRDSVEYLGYKIDANGVHPLPHKVQAVLDAPAPRNVKELKAYLGMLSYYSRFIPNLSAVLAPLHQLLKASTPWLWTHQTQQVFQTSKQLLASAGVLVHYDPALELIVAGDVSDYGLGAVLSQKMRNGEERPVAFASRSLSAAEKNYSQVEKETLACIFAVKRFHSYLYGRKFTLTTDHKPLLTLLGEHKPILHQASARIQRWALILSAYKYKIAFKPSSSHCNGDGLSRLPLEEAPAEVPQPAELVFLMEHLQDGPVKAHEIRRWTRQDPTLARVLQFIQSGWPTSGDPELKPFWFKRNELSSEEGCILWGARVVVPSPGRKRVLKELHEGHPGIARMKGLARMHMWWPRMDLDIEQVVRKCEDCQKNQAAPPPRHHCNSGAGQSNHGPEFMQDHCKEACTWL